MSNIFERDYQMLELGRDAAWADVRLSYRRLVNRWHPDRFSTRPREKQLAQSRFIEVTKAYNNLRAFHREHSRLPLQDPKLRTESQTQTAGTPPEPPVKSGKLNTAKLNEDLFTTDTSQRKPAKPRYWLLAIPVVAIIGVLALFVILENRLEQQRRDKAIEVLRSTQPSDFMPKN